MKSRERVFAYIFIQMSLLALLFLYVALTWEAYMTNVYCFAAAVLLGAIGFFRPFGETVFAALLAVCIYGGYVAFGMYSGSGGATLGWNDMVWLLVLPLSAVAGGLREPRSEQAEQAARQLAYEKKRLAKDTAAAEEVMPLDETLGFAVNRDVFDKRLAAAVEEALADPSGPDHALLVIETQNYWDYKEQYGFEMTLSLLHSTAELINGAIPSPKVKGYLGGGAFAVFFPISDLLSPTYVEVELNVKYNAMVLSKPRRDGYSRTRLRYGLALFPTHTSEPAALLSRAKQELDRNLRDL